MMMRTTHSHWQNLHVSAIVAMLVARQVWEAWPSANTCALSWAAAMLWCGCNIAITGRQLLPARLLVAAGMISNCIVTLANGGFMPVTQPAHRLYGVWVDAAPHSRLVFLADRLAWSTSVGDWFIGAGVGPGLALATYHGVRAALTPSPAISGAGLTVVAVPFASKEGDA